MTAFSDYVEHHGWATVASPTDHWSKTMLKFFDRRLREALGNDEPSPFEIGIVRDPSFNAFASQHDGVDLIGICSGVFNVLPFLTLAIFSYPEIFEDVGSIVGREKYVSPVPYSDIIAGNFPQLDFKLEGARGETAMRATQAALHFLFEHELAHILNGHVAYDDKHGFSAVIEADAGELSASAGLVRQTLEWDADASALGIVMQFLLRPTIEMKEGVSRWILPTEMAEAEIIRTVQIISFASILVGMNFAADSNWGPLNLAHTHPPAAYRYWTQMQEVSETLVYRLGDPSEKWEPVVSNIALNMLQAWSGIFPSSPKQHGAATDELNALFAACHQAYSDCWAEIRDELVEDARHKDLAPARPVPNPHFSGDSHAH